MANAIPQWLLGQNATSVTVRYQTTDSAGVLGNGSGSTQTITAIVDSVQTQIRNETEEIRAVTSSRANQVVLESNDMMVLTEIMQDGATAGTKPQLAALRFNAESPQAKHCIVTYARGGNTFSHTGRIASYRERGGKGKCTATVVVEVVDILDSVTGAVVANPTYS